MARTESLLIAVIAVIMAVCFQEGTWNLKKYFQCVSTYQIKKCFLRINIK